MRETNVFSLPELENEDENYFVQLKASPGSYTFMVYDPTTDKFYRREIIVAEKISI